MEETKEEQLLNEVARVAGIYGSVGEIQFLMNVLEEVKQDNLTDIVFVTSCVNAIAKLETQLENVKRIYGDSPE